MSQSYRIKQSEVKKYRDDLYIKQGTKCALCRMPINVGEAALDHCHKTGVLRGTLHRGCNAMLGHIENNLARHKLTNTAKLSAFLRNIIPYVHMADPNAPLHYTFRTEEEKRLKRNAKARKTRAKAKETT